MTPSFDLITWNIEKLFLNSCTKEAKYFLWGQRDQINGLRYGRDKRPNLSKEGNFNLARQTLNILRI
jgi:hypothetical protein